MTLKQVLMKHRPSITLKSYGSNERTSSIPQFVVSRFRELCRLRKVTESVCDQDVSERTKHARVRALKRSALEVSDMILAFTISGKAVEYEWRAKKHVLRTARRHGR